MSFKEKYGEWAFVAGGSEGLGGAYCTKLASEGMNVVVSGRHIETIEAKRKELEEKFGVQTKGIVVDLGSINALETIKKEVEGLEIGFLVYCAGISSMGLYSERDIEYELWRLNVNVRSLLALSIYFSKGMVERGRGGMVLMSSCGGICGSPYLQTYSATKAYIFTLAEALWSELAPYGVEVISAIAGATISQSLNVPVGTPGVQTAEEVVEEAFAHIGKDPTVICGQWNREMFEKVYLMDERKAIIEHVKNEVHNSGVADMFQKGKYVYDK